MCSASLDKQWHKEFVPQITVLNNREFSIAKQKSHSIQEQETNGLHRESKCDLLTENSDFFFDLHGYERQIRISCFGHVPTPAKHVLLVHMNMLQGMKIHEGLKIRHVIINKHFKCVHVNVNCRGSVCWATGCPYRCLWSEHLDENCLCNLLKNNSFRKLLQLSKCTCDYFPKKPE